MEESDFSERRLPRVVDLNNAGALEVVRRVKPEHYRAVLKILDTVVLSPGADAGSVGEYDVDYPNILLTSMPPQRPLRFTIDETRYEAKIVLTSVCALPALK